MKNTKTLVIQMDEPASFKPASDSTIALALEAQKLDYEIYYYTPSQLSCVNGEIIANAKPIKFFARDDDFFECGEPVIINLEEANVILIRQNPPYNIEYLGCTWLLERLKKPKIFNNPKSIRNRPEKIFPLEFPDFIPPTCISADREILTEFYHEHKDIVIKPLYGFGGTSIYHIQNNDNNFTKISNELLENGEPIILQPYLPDVITGEKRILLINGNIAGAFNRLPPKGDFRTNGAVGGSAIKTSLTTRQKEIAIAVGRVCKNEGLLLVGLDVIGEHLIEINTTCPTGIPAHDKLYGTNLASQFWQEM